MGEQALPFVVCAFFGAVLAAIELLQTFGRWMGNHWLNRHVAKLIALNVLAACAVYAVLRFGLGVEDALRLAVVTGLTFPAILRSKFTLFRAAGRDEDSPRELSIPIDAWYQNLQGLCVDEVNARIADATAREMRRLRECLSEPRMIEILADHIEAEPHPQSKEKHQRQLAQIRAMSDPTDRVRRLARLMIEIMPQGALQELVAGKTSK